MSDRSWTSPEHRIAPTRKQRVEIFMKTGGCCYVCHQKLTAKGWEAEHPQALELMGPADIAALMPICKPCHKVKTATDQKAIAKAKRVRDKAIGAFKKTSRPIPGSKASGWKKPLNKPAERR